MQTRDQYDNASIRRTFERIARETIADNGGTYQHKTGARVDLARQYGSGYVVSVAEYGECLAAPLATLGERIADVWPKHIASDVQYVGTWQHRGLVFVDGSVVLPESARDIALALARKHGQTAIYNIRTASAELVEKDDVPNADDVYQAVRAIVGSTSPEDSYNLPRVSVRLCGVPIDDVLVLVFGADVWSDGEPVNDDDDDDAIYALYNDTILPDDQLGAYTYNYDDDVLTVWGFYS